MEVSGCRFWFHVSDKAIVLHEQRSHSAVHVPQSFNEDFSRTVATSARPRTSTLPIVRPIQEYF